MKMPYWLILLVRLTGFSVVVCAGVAIERKDPLLLACLIGAIGGRLVAYSFEEEHNK